MIIAITVVITIIILLLLIILVINNNINNNGNFDKNQVLWLKKCFSRLCLKALSYRFSLMSLGLDTKMKNQ